MELNRLNTNLEKLPLTIYNNKDEGSVFVAKEIAATIRANNMKAKNTVLGLATGSSPLAVYRELIHIHQEEGLSFKNLTTFNLDEYYPIQPTDRNCFRRFMYLHLFDHIDIKPENIHIPDGSLSAREISKFCQEYEQNIESNGGIDIQLLGVGRSGHIGFNEPGSRNSTNTRLVQLNKLTIEDAINDFGKKEDVPLRALTMGVKTILKARKIFLLAWGESKSEILQKAIDGSVDSSVPASYLQLHHNIHIIADSWAASKLSRFMTPGLSDVAFETITGK